MARRDREFRPIVLPKFMKNLSEPGMETVSYGYQEAHELYNDMRHFFAQRAMATGNTEVVTVKMMMMTLRPGLKNPQVVSVHDNGC